MIVYPGTNQWHSRVLLMKASAAAYQEMYHEVPGSVDDLWWILTPDADIYIEQLGGTFLEQVSECDDDGNFARPARSPPANRVHRFTPARAAGAVNPLVMGRAMMEAQAVEQRFESQPVLRTMTADEGQPPVLVGGFVRCIMFDSSAGDRVGTAYGGTGSMAAQHKYIGDWGLAVDGDHAYLFKKMSPTDHAAFNRKHEEDQAADVRVLPVAWTNSEKRGRGFKEAVQLMSHVDFGDWPVESEPTLEWLLQETCSSGECTVQRHHNWTANAHIPSGDRSIHEHFCISKVLKVAAEIDQLNLPTLLSFELLGRRLQLIEAAQQHSPANPDYTSAADYRGWGPQRGAALVAPSLRRHVATSARERVEVMKELRKQGEELRLKYPKKPKARARGRTGQRPTGPQRALDLRALPGRGCVGRLRQ